MNKPSFSSLNKKVVAPLTALTVAAFAGASLQKHFGSKIQDKVTVSSDIEKTKVNPNIDIQPDITPVKFSGMLQLPDSIAYTSYDLYSKKGLAEMHQELAVAKLPAISQHNLEKLLFRIPWTIEDKQLHEVEKLSPVAAEALKDLISIGEILQKTHKKDISALAHRYSQEYKRYKQVRDSSLPYYSAGEKISKNVNPDKNALEKYNALREYWLEDLDPIEE